jgi:four helix bundle protein
LISWALFENLRISKFGRLREKLSLKVFHLTEMGPASKDYKFKDQIRASAGSIMDNIAEGFERSSQFEFVNFLGISKGSSGETRSQLCRGIDQKYFSEETVDLIKEYEDLASNISGFMKYLNQSEIRGQKFKDRNQ